MSGILAVHAASGIGPDTEPYVRALRRLAHRGSAGEGIHHRSTLFLGVCRRANERGLDEEQPVVGAGGTVAVALDGRLVSRTAEPSDPAFVLAAYLEHGEACFARLRGVFAIVVWDERTRRLLLARDPLGVRPLYYFAGGGRLLVASEIKAILDLDPAARAVNHGRLRRLVHDGEMDDWTDTCFTHIHPVPPGSVVHVERDRISTAPYWTARSSTTRALDVPSIREQLAAAVARHTPAAGPVGLALSGGIDSAAIAGILAGSCGPGGPRIEAFSITPPQTTDESFLIDATVRRTGIPHTYVGLDALDYPRLVEELVDAHDEPVHSSGTLYQFALRRHIAEAGCRAVLVGYGADEIFAGYPALAVPFLLGLVASGRIREARRFVLGAQPLLQLPPRRIVAQALGSAIAGRRAAAVRALKCALGADPRASWRGGMAQRDVLARREGAPDAEPRDAAPGFRGALAACFRMNIPLLVRMEDRNAMAHGLELCAPFMDQELVETALSLPAHAYMAGGRNKAVLRDAVRTLLAPEVHAYPRKLATPGNDAHVAFDLLASEIQDLVRSTSFRQSGLWSERAADLYAEDRARRKRGSLWYRVYVVHTWYERVVRAVGS